MFYSHKVLTMRNAKVTVCPGYHCLAVPRSANELQKANFSFYRVRCLCCTSCILRHSSLKHCLNFSTYGYLSPNMFTPPFKSGLVFTRLMAFKKKAPLCFFFISCQRKWSKNRTREQPLGPGWMGSTAMGSLRLGGAHGTLPRHPATLW